MITDRSSGRIRTITTRCYHSSTTCHESSKAERKMQTEGRYAES